MSSLANTSAQTLFQAAAAGYEKFNAFSYAAASKILISDAKTGVLSNLGSHESSLRQDSVATLVKVGLVVLGLMSLWVIISHPILFLSAVVVGAIVNLEKETKEGIRSWLDMAYPLAITPILNNETPLEKAALAALATSIAALAATTIVAPTVLGILGGYKLRSYFSTSPAVATA